MPVTSAFKKSVYPEPGLALRQLGFSLIEMLIALLVLSFGLLGIAGLQAQSLKNNQSAYLRSQASLVAYEIIDRMRANRNAAVNGGYDYQAGAIADPVPGWPTCSGPLACDDLTEWKTRFEQILPAGAAAVSCNGGTSICQVAVEWDDTRGGADAVRIMVSTEI
jgi:type IV pilus assembly protein PilV